MEIQVEKNNENEKEVLIHGKENVKDEDILNFFVKRGFLLNKEVARFFREFQNRYLLEDILNRVFTLSKTRIITKEVLINYYEDLRILFLELEKENKEAVDSFFDNKKEDIQGVENIADDDFRASFRVLSKDVGLDKKLEIRDFVRHFKERYGFLKDLLVEKKGVANLVSMDKVAEGGDFSIVGMVVSKKITKNKNVLIEVEDVTGRIKVLINHDREDLIAISKEIVVDDVLVVRGSFAKEMLFAGEIFYTDSFLEERRGLEKESYCLFISDIHLGSKNFLESNFSKFIDWLNCKGLNEKQKEQIKKIKYLFILGDNVDGIGVFPGQEDTLNIKNIKEQYKQLALFLDRIPKSIHVIMCPGQHDAVRVAEPQNPISEYFAKSLTKIENLHLVSNPALVEIGDKSDSNNMLKVLMYHGASMHGIINNIEDLRIKKAHLTPSKVVKYLLKKRHLAPSHGVGNIYVPAKEGDPLLIRDVPDIVATGDLHRCDSDWYNNIQIICSGCWQSITSFEEKVGNSPDPGKVPMLNLQTREVKILDFS